MKKKRVIIFFILLIAIAGLFFALRIKENKVCFKDNCYIVEIARTQTEKEKGLMYRENLDKRQGMLFINEEEKIYPFWMKNMNFPLDIIWLDENYKVVFVAQNAQPCDDKCEKIIPDSEARYVLEINAGEADRIGLEEADVMVLKNNPSQPSLILRGGERNGK